MTSGEIVMKGWVVRLSEGVRRALDSGEPTRVAVHSEAQADLAMRAANRLAAINKSLDASHVIPELIPENEYGIYQVGAILHLDDKSEKL